MDKKINIGQNKFKLRAIITIALVTACLLSVVLIYNYVDSNSAFNNQELDGGGARLFS